MEIRIVEVYTLVLTEAEMRILIGSLKYSDEEGSETAHDLQKMIEEVRKERTKK